MSRARELSRLGNPNIISADSSFNVGFGTTEPKEKVNVVGVVSATAFYGDGSTLEGIASAGIGTALSDDKTKALNTIYFTNNEVTVTNNSVVNPPDSGHIAYTQAPTVVIEDTKELIVSDGDDLLVDVLGIATGVNVDYAARGNGVFGNIYVDNIESSGGQTSVNFPKGLVSTGVATFHSDVSIGGTLTYEDVKNIDSVGLITARTGIKVTAGGVDIDGGGIDIVGDIGLGAGAQTGTAGQVLTSGGVGANATWTSISASPTAEGVAGLNIANGAAVAVASTDGKFYPVTGTNEVFGTSAEFTSDETSYPSIIYDTANSRVIVVWQGYSDDDGYALVGTISGTTISWGSNQKWNGNTNSRPNRITYDSVNEKIVIAFKEDNGTIKAVVGAVSGSTISWGTIVTVYSGSHGRNPDISFDSSTGKVVVVYKKNDTAKAYCRVGTVSGTDITFGTEVISLDTTVEQLSLACNGGYVVVVSEEHVRVGQISGTDITFGTMGTIPYSNGATGSNIPSVDIVVDPNTDVWAISAARNNTLEFFGATRSGTTLSFGTGLIFNKTTACNHSLAWTGSENRFFQTFVSGTSASDGMQSAIVEVFGNNAVLRSGPRQFKGDTNGTDQYDQTDCCLTVDGKMVVAFQYTTGSRHGWYYVEQTRVSNGTNSGFVGMSQAAYSAGQTAKVSITGAVSTNQTGLSTASPYYLNGDGTLAQGVPDSENLFVGNALSTTNLLLK